MFIDDLVTLLQVGGCGTFGTTIFSGPKASIPGPGAGAFLTLRETGGSKPDIIQNTPLLPGYVKPSAQIVARSDDVKEARDLIQLAYGVLFPVRNQFVNGTWWVWIMMVQEPFDLGEDEDGRPRFAFNIDCYKRLSPATS